MKNVIDFSEFVNEGIVNEGAKIELSVHDEYFNLKKESAAVKKAKIVFKPITIASVWGDISEDDTDVQMVLSNGDEVNYVYLAGQEPVLELFPQERIKTNHPIHFGRNDIEDYFYSGVVVEGMFNLYKAWKEGKLKAIGDGKF